MKNRIRILLKKGVLIVMLTAAAAVLFLSGLSVYHQAMLKKEQELMERIPGGYVEIGGHQFHIYTAGAGDKTLVFLPGTGTPSPVLDFKPLYSRLSGRYRIAVPEKFGYGCSDDYEGERSADVVTEQDREALRKAGIEGPYILVPHSASGVEAVWWANHYPEEVEAIIGLDMNVPEQYSHYRIPADLDGMAPEDPEKVIAANAVSDFFLYRVGLARLLYDLDELFPVLAGDGLSEEEKAQYQAVAYVMYCRGSRAAWYRECLMDEHALAVMREYVHGPHPDVPTLLFVSDGTVMGPVMDPSEWARAHMEYARGLSRGDIINLDCGHYVHVEMPAEAAAKMTEFIDSLR